jgi:hypothetical protein
MFRFKFFSLTDSTRTSSFFAIKTDDEKFKNFLIKNTKLGNKFLKERNNIIVILVNIDSGEIFCDPTEWNNSLTSNFHEVLFDEGTYWDF